MSEAAEKRAKVNAFGHVQPRVVETEATHPLMDVWSVELDKDTGTAVPVVVRQEDLHELAQSFKDQCGMSVAKRMIAQTGDPNLFADDGQHSADISHIPDNLNDLHHAKQDNVEFMRQLGASLGVDLTGLSLEDIEGLILKEKEKQGSTATEQAVNTSVQESNKE